ncbi:MAG: FmdE family protein [Thermoleophilia bacterium]|nr:FmdE family protein [Thermoleophilia bacterium]
MTTLTKTLEEHLEEAAALHGGDCPGQTLGVRIARAGLERIGIDDPLSDRWRKNIMVYVEIDRCAADALMAVTGCRVGKRTLKLADYGIMAATFINLESGKAVRVVAREKARELAPKYAPGERNKYEQQRLAYRVMPDGELLDIEEVKVTIPPEDMPGSPISRVTCEKCGDTVVDMREVVVDGFTLCRPCARGGYFTR